MEYGDGLLHILEMEMEFDEQVNALIMESSSDEEESRKRGGSAPGKAPNKGRDFHGAYMTVIKHYFSGRESLYSEADFERRFRLPRSVFNRIHDALMGTNPFVHKEDATKKKGIYPLVKLVACFRYLAYGDAFDREDEHLQIGESTLSVYTKQFAKLLKENFGAQYLNRSPTATERKNISTAMGGKGFPGCLASWDCKHFNWKNCPTRLAGQYQGHSEGGKKTIILEAIADHRKYIWYANFGDAGSLNDLNVLDKSSIVGALIGGSLSLSIDEYKINGKARDWMYFLVDGIYPEWAIFVNTFSNPDDSKKKYFATQQEKVRKDIECAFGILVQKFHILQRPLRGWYLEELKDIVDACVILHNMTVEARFGSVDSGEQIYTNTSGFSSFGRQQITAEQAAADSIVLFAARVAAFDTAMQSSYEHYLLKRDLVEHINSLKGT